MNLGQEQGGEQTMNSSEAPRGQEEVRSAQGQQEQPEDDLKKFAEDLRRSFHCLPPLRLLLLELKDKESVDVSLRMTDMAEVERLAKKMRIECHGGCECLPGILDAYDLYPDVNEMLYMGLISYFAVQGCSQTVQYLVEGRRESIRPMITVLRFLVAQEVIEVKVVVAKLVRAELKCFEEKRPPPEEERVCLVMEITRGNRWKNFYDIVFEKKRSRR